MFPSPGFTPRPRTGKGYSGCAKDCRIAKHQQDSVTNEAVSERQNRVGHFCRILVGEPMLVRDIAHDNHGSGNRDGETSSEEGVQTSPFQVGKAQSFVSDAALLKEELPRSDGGADNGNDHEHQVSCDSSRRNTRNQRVPDH